ncbi:pentapeptide repeat-containing protein [Halosimplex litoreum]|uniref:Pentapeptide repeat-containing protein n=1 Tax=Halosimplex litoreum TaxID=1198301 RepID=A0A7T3G1X8_9EURY|nr:pentapeptide repeat-containing protein [Halosimplex litoreum]QPV64433.1 pentapeptide repeat-containing protein [Halosimplex litoreum]
MTGRGDGSSERGAVEAFEAANGVGDAGGDVEAATEVLRCSPDERAERGVSDDDVRAAFLTVVREGDADAKDLRGVELPAIELDRLTVDGADRHPVDLRGATVASLSARFATIRLPLRLDDATLGDVTFDEAHVEEAVLADGATVTGDFEAFEARFAGDVEFDGATFEGRFDVDESTFANDVTFDGATFDGVVEARAAEFYGDSNLLDDNTSFTGATFADLADFRQAEFGFTHFERATFADEANFQEASFDGDAEFDEAVFEAFADFDEARFGGDTGFADVAFTGDADFRGAAFSGRERALDEDATFAGSTFGGDADFRHARFRFVTFAEVAFEGRVHFEEAEFDADATFADARFAAETDFDEARFREDADFSAVEFAARAVFRGAEFTGGANFLEDDLTFEGAHFGADADFHNAEVTSANFVDTTFGGEIDFSGASFSERIDFEASQVDGDAWVDFTRAKIVSGRIAQPAENWVRYDLTLASLGDVELVAAADEDHRRLLDFFRFCRTEFTEFDGHEFDFSAHREYLDRNAWAIHEFHEPPDADPDYELAMTPEVTETTYLKAKQSAAAVGDMKVAGEFRVKRQQYSRAKNLEVARDDSAATWTRTKNLGRAAENYFLGVTCGHGMRPIRIGFAFVLAPLLYVPFYAFGGGPFLTAAGQLSVAEAFTTDGLATLFDVARFSYISYTTIGYGFLGPEGRLAEVLAASEAYLSVVLSALLVYALVKRSEM